jgi:3D-(3,5/4)-trihydroxycyclohexane-1,2-dione acylhydrolase (decyclizing)
MTTVRLTVGQAIVRFLVAQHSERDGVEHRLVEGMFGIFGHGNVAGLGEAILESELADPRAMPYHQGRNEQGMVHAATAFARQRNRLSTLACLSSVGPGATNMVTGAATATVNRLPVLLLPSDVFANRVADPVLQQLEHPMAGDVSVNDAFRPVSRFFDRVWRPEQLPAALLGAMRVLTDPVETGAVVVALPEDVQAEARDWPVELFERRVWHVARPAGDPAAVERAIAAIRASSRPLIVSGGGTIYSEATDALRAFVEATGIPVAETFAGKGSLPYDHPSSVGAIGATGGTAANALGHEADLVIGIGTRWGDFPTASRSAFQDPDVRFVNVNVASFDAAKHSGLMLQADARSALEALTAGLAGWSVSDELRSRARALAADWDATVEGAYHLDHGPLPAQSEVIGAVNDLSGARDIVVCAAGSLPGDLHKLWRTRDPKGFHVEYGYSCMGYEVAGGLGIKMAAPDRDVFVMVGDGSWLMLSSEIVTAVQERVPLVVVLIQNHGYQSIGALSESVGSQRFGTRYRFRTASGRLDGDTLPVDLAANAESLGARVIRTTTIDELRDALRQVKAEDRTGPVVIHIETDPLVPAPDGGGWWDVPIAETSTLDSVATALGDYREAKARQRPLITPSER